MEERTLDARLIIAIVSVGLLSFSGVLVETALNIALPTLMNEFHVSTGLVQWLTTGYLLTLSLTIPTSSYLTRCYTNTQIFATATIIFILGTALGGYGQAFWMILLGRLIQGIGTGLVLPLMFRIILTQVPFSRLGLMMGFGTLITGFAPAVGPMLGGALLQSLNWHWIFYILLPFLITAFIVGLFTIRNTGTTHKAPFDWSGYALLAICFSALMLALNILGSKGIFDITFIALVVLTIVSMCLFVAQTKRSAHPIINLAIFSYRGFNAGLVGIMGIMFVVLAQSFVLPNFSQIVLNVDPQTAGFIMVPGSLLGLIVAPIAGRIADRFGAKLPIFVAAAALIASQMLYCIVLQQSNVAIIIALYIVFAVGQFAQLGNVMNQSIACLPKELSTDGNTVVNTLQQLGGALGVSCTAAILGTCQAQIKPLSQGTFLGSQSTFALLAAFAVIVLIADIALLKMRSKSQQAQNQQ